MRALAVFDIDGTLTATNAVDDACFVSAVTEIFELHLASVDWSDAPHVTDADLVRWLCVTRHGRPPSADELTRAIDRFVELLRAELRRAPERFAPIPGAPGLLPRLREAGWDVALATGGWRPSAQLKLAAARLDEPGLVLASASDAPTRAEILQLALRGACEQTRADFGRVVSVGDAVWDVHTAAELGWRFIGVGGGAQADVLRAAGASVVLPDFQDFAAVRAALETASVPRASGEARLRGGLTSA